MVLAHLLIERAGVGHLAQLERQPQRIERGPPDAALAVGPAEHGEAVGFLVAVAGALIGDVGGGLGALQQFAALALVRRPQQHGGAGEAKPARAFVRSGRDDLAEQHHAVADVVLLERGVGVAAQLRQRLGGRARVALDLAFEVDRGGIEVGVLEGLVGGERRGRTGKKNGRKGDERGQKADAGARNHGWYPPCPGGRGNFRGATIKSHSRIMSKA